MQIPLLSDAQIRLVRTQNGEFKVRKRCASERGYRGDIAGQRAGQATGYERRVTRPRISAAALADGDVRASVG